MSFFLFFLFFRLSLNWERERERERERVIAMLKTVIGETVLMFTYLLDGFLRGVFSLLRAGGFIHIALAWRHRFLLSKILSASSPGVWHDILPICSPRHLSSKLIFFTAISADGRRCHFCLRVLANHFASIFFLPLSGDSVGLLSLSPGHRVQTLVGFHSDLDL